MQYLKIPQRRVGVLIGEEGKVKKKIEEKTKSKIEVDEGEVSIEGDPVDEWATVDVVKAIGRGFSPERALKILQEKNTFKVISVRDFCNTRNSIRRLKGRVIGEDGKAKRVIQSLTGTYLCIYGDTISMIGTYDGVEVASKAVRKLLDGAPHSTVYRFLEKNASRLKKPKL